MSLEGIWEKNKLVKITRKIEEGTIMTEFKRNGANTIASNRIPVYVGEFVYDEWKESFTRNGIGYLIDEESRIATRECEWKDGVEVSGRDLIDGWYTRSLFPVYFIILMHKSHCISHCFVDQIEIKLYIHSFIIEFISKIPSTTLLNPLFCLLYCNSYPRFHSMNYYSFSAISFSRLKIDYYCADKE